jgi:glycosyltransferase involved in cell wall biosynthesis
LSAPLLTVVVPVHRVEKYLHQCLDSVLADDRPEIEIVAVDDCSPDRCGEMLDDYARLHERVRVVHLGANVGLGPARNVGLEQARGEYVWFVDSDDWLPTGSVAAVLDRLAELNRPGRRPVDVLLVDHLRAYSDGGLLPDPSSRLLRAAPNRPLAGLAEHPELISVQHTAWNKHDDALDLGRWGMTERPDWNALYSMFNDLGKAVQGLEQTQRKIFEVTGTAWSPDRLIKVVVGPRGQLTELEIDPRIYRTPNSKALAATILDTVRRAVDDAMRQTNEALDASVPGDMRISKIGSIDVRRMLTRHDADLTRADEEEQ